MIHERHEFLEDPVFHITQGVEAFHRTLYALQNVLTRAGEFAAAEFFESIADVRQHFQGTRAGEALKGFFRNRVRLHVTAQPAAGTAQIFVVAMAYVVLHDIQKYVRRNRMFDRTGRQLVDRLRFAFE